MSALKEQWTDVAKMGGRDGRDDLQHGWQAWAGSLFRNVEILDVGSGLGHSRERLRASGNIVKLQDIGPNLPADLTLPIDQIVDRAFDVVTCFDVLEHVAEDAAFVADLVRIGRQWVVITTPNFEISRAQNHFHCREYTGAELLDLLSPYCVHSLWGGNSNGTDRTLLTEAQFRSHLWPSHAVILHCSGI